MQARRAADHRRIQGQGLPPRGLYPEAVFYGGSQMGEQPVGVHEHLARRWRQSLPAQVTGFRLGLLPKVQRHLRVAKEVGGFHGRKGSARSSIASVGRVPTYVSDDCYSR